MGSKTLRINKNFGQNHFDLREYRLGSYHGFDFLVSKECSANGEKVVDNSDGKLAKENRTADVIRQLKSNDWTVCFAPECIMNYLLNIDPTCFRRVNEMILFDDDGDIILED